MTVDDVAADLLAQPLDAFTAGRNARAKELKASGESELAAQVSALRKPSVPLWAANQVGRRDGMALGAVEAPAQALKKAQAAAAQGRPNAGRDLQAASAEFQRALDGAQDAAAEVLRAAKHATSEDTLRRVREIIRQAALQGGDSWHQLERGALMTEPAAGQDMLQLFAAGAQPATGKRAAQVEAKQVQQEAERKARTDAEAAERAQAKAERLRHQADDLTAAAKRAEQDARQAEKEAAQATAQAAKSARGIQH